MVCNLVCRGTMRLVGGEIKKGRSRHLHLLIPSLLRSPLFLQKVLNRGVLPYNGLVFFILMVENLGVLEVLNERVEALETGVGEGADLHAGRSTFSLLNFPHRLPWNSR